MLLNFLSETIGHVHAKLTLRAVHENVYINGDGLHAWLEAASRRRTWLGYSTLLAATICSTPRGPPILVLRSIAHVGRYRATCMCCRTDRVLSMLDVLSTIVWELVFFYPVFLSTFEGLRVKLTFELNRWIF